MKNLFVGLSGFCSDFSVLVSNEVVWIIKKIQISDNFWILQNVVPNFIDTDNCSLRMFPVLLFLLFCLLELIRSNTFGIVQKIAGWIKIPSSDVDTVQ